LLVDWLKSDGVTLKSSWKRRELLILTTIFSSIIIKLVVGLYTRELSLMLLIFGFLAILGYPLFKYPRTSTEKLLSRLYGWAIYILVIGLAFEPYQGGIKKDSATFSYYFVTTAIAILLLIILMIVIDLLKLDSYLSLLIDNGQNSMIAYVSYGNLILPIFALTTWQETIDQWIANNALLGLIKGLVYTFLVVLVTSLCTKLKLFWKT